MHYLSAGAIFSKENSWLDEWIRYHRTLGVEHFYLFDDDEDRKVSRRILRPYVDSGIVDHIPVPESMKQGDPRWRQQSVYREIFSLAARSTRWIAMIDLDEFILPRRHDDIRELLRDYEEYGGLAMNWTLFGTGGYVRRPPSQIDHLFYRAGQQWVQNRYFKSIVRPDLVDTSRLYDAHHFFLDGAETVNENYEPVFGLSHDVSTGRIRLNHYVLRSWQDFWEVKATRDRFNHALPCDEEYFHWHDRNNVFDDEISRRFGYAIAASERNAR